MIWQISEHQKKMPKTSILEEPETVLWNESEPQNVPIAYHELFAKLIDAAQLQFDKYHTPIRFNGAQYQLPLLDISFSNDDLTEDQFRLFFVQHIHKKRVKLECLILFR